jgi:hypothetical protein
MVGTTRFELATSPTPRVRSTRLSHVPTFVARIVQANDGRVCCSFKCTRTATVSTPADSLVGRRHELFWQRAAFALAEEEAVHLLHQKILRLSGPWL